MPVYLIEDIADGTNWIHNAGSYFYQCLDGGSQSEYIYCYTDYASGLKIKLAPAMRPDSDQIYLRTAVQNRGDSGTDPVLRVYFLYYDETSESWERNGYINLDVASIPDDSWSSKEGYIDINRALVDDWKLIGLYIPLWNSMNRQE